MKNFEFYSPTRIIFGKDILKGLVPEIKAFGNRVLFVYGRSSIKTSGLYDRIMGMLEEAGAAVTEFSGVEPNPKLLHAEKGAAVAAEIKADVVLAVGGGSVLDEAKAIAAGAVNSGDLWDYYSGKKLLRQLFR